MVYLSSTLDTVPPPAEVGLAGRPTTAVRDVPLGHGLSQSASIAGRYLLQNLATSLPLMFADVAGVVVACSVTAGLATTLERSLHVSVMEMALGGSLAVVLCFALLELYPACGIHPAVELRQAAIGLTLIGISAAMLGSGGPFSLSPLWFVWSLTAAVLVAILRSTTRKFFGRFDWWRQPVLIAGDHEAVRHVSHLLSRDGSSGLRPVTTGGTHYRVDAAGASPAPAWVPQPFRPPAERTHRVAVSSLAELSHLMRIPGSGMRHVHLITPSTSAPALWVRSSEFGGHAVASYSDHVSSPLAMCVKRGMDLSILALAAPFLLPVILVLALLVKLSSPGPIFYAQRRIGRYGKNFSAWKFRSMVANADAVLREHLENDAALRDEWERDHKLKKDPRVTGVGKFLRKSSLDELPQVWNVLLGEMSLVGPRPIVDDEIAKYGEVFSLYTRVRPGITGLWQVSGRNNTTYQERLAFDRSYVRNWSPWLDAYILLRTVRTVLMGEGAY